MRKSQKGRMPFRFGPINWEAYAPLTEEQIREVVRAYREAHPSLPAISVLVFGDFLHYAAEEGDGH